MAKLNKPVFTQNIVNTVTTIDNTLAPNTFIAISSGGPDDSRITQISLHSTNGSSVTCSFAINNCIIASLSIAPNSINNILQNGNFSFKRNDVNGNPFFELESGNFLQISLSSSLSSGGVIGVVVTKEDY